MTTKQLLMKLLPMAISLIILLVIAFSCSAFSGRTEYPSLSNSDEAFVTMGDIEVTNEEVYNKLVNQFGARTVKNMIDTSLLSNGETNYIQMAKNDPEFNIEEMVERAIYNGYTYNEAQGYYTLESLEELEVEFEDILVYNGYASIDEFTNDLYLDRARSLYTKDQLYISEEITGNTLRLEYEGNFYDSVQAIIIPVSTELEASTLLLQEGLALNEDGEFPEFISEEQILNAYINIYNRLGLGTTLTTENLDNEDLTYNYDEMLNLSLRDYVFKTLHTDSEEQTPYTSTIGINTGETVNFYLIYKVSGDNQNDFQTVYPNLSVDQYNEMLETNYNELTQNDTIDALYEQVITNRSESSTYVDLKMSELSATHELTIYDEFLKFNYDVVYGETVENEGHDSIAFSYKNNNMETVNVTADELFENLEQNVPSVVIALLNARMSVADEALVEEVVTDELEAEMTMQVNEYKLGFQQNSYVQYGFDSTQMSWEEFVYAAFQYRSELELYNALVESKVVEEFKIRLFTSDEIQDIYFDLMAEAYDNAFELDVKHFLVYLDQNNDLVPDLVNDTNWSAEQTDLANELVDALRARLTELNNAEEVTMEALQEVVSEYMNASYDNEPTSEFYSEWAKYKLAGLQVKAEDLSTVTQGQMVPTFEDELKAMYATMTADSLFTLISENNIETQFGYHLIYSDAYYDKADAYPEDEKVYPSRLDIQAFNNNEFDGLSTETLVFIGKYYTPVANDYTDQYELVLFDDARADYGTITFSESKFLDNYNKVVELNKLIAER